MNQKHPNLSSTKFSRLGLMAIVLVIAMGTSGCGQATTNVDTPVPETDVSTQETITTAETMEEEPPAEEPLAETETSEEEPPAEPEPLEEDAPEMDDAPVGATLSDYTGSWHLDRYEDSVECYAGFSLTEENGTYYFLASQCGIMATESMELTPWNYPPTMSVP